MVLRDALWLRRTAASDPDVRRQLMLDSIRRGLGWLLPDRTGTTRPRIIG